MNPFADDQQNMLAQILDEDVDKFVAKCAKRVNEEPTDEKSIDEIAAELLRHPVFMKANDPMLDGKLVNEELEGLMQLKYECEDPLACANNYRIEGNNLFAKKEYHLAIDNYSEALRSSSSCSSLEAVLYANRAAAQFYLGNYLSSLTDCLWARRRKPDHLKAIIRGAHCCDRMDRPHDTVQWCEAGLLVDPGRKDLIDLKSRAEKAVHVLEWGKRRQQYMDRRKGAESLRLLDALKSRNISIRSLVDGDSDDDDDIGQSTRESHMLSDLETVHPSGGARVTMSEDGVLYWPVVFLYPEYSESDFISSFCENHTFADHLDHMFGPQSESVCWDVEHTYVSGDLEVYFKDTIGDILYPVNKHKSLLDVLQHKRYTVLRGTPAFIVVVKGSPFQQQYLSQIELLSPDV